MYDEVTEHGAKEVRCAYDKSVTQCRAHTDTHAPCITIVKMLYTTANTHTQSSI